jgi:methylated-DNA-[protein]-cysteine S-methyltransferase
MIRELFYVTFSTAAGWVGILGSTAGLVRTTLPQPTPEVIFQQLGINQDQATLSPHRFQSLMERLMAYYSGHKAAFLDRLDLSTATDFQREVWQATRLIPYGETRSYTWVAGQIKKPGAVRAVGQALGRNPLPVIVPCHRVLASNGRLGGFSGGLEMKRFLLHLEATAGIK